MSPACGREWTRQYITNAFTTSFINGKLKKHKEQVLFDGERALLPATQPIVERQIKLENLAIEQANIKKQIQELQYLKIQTQAEIWNIQSNRTPIERTEFVKPCLDTECRGFLSTQWKCGLCQKWSCPHCHEIKGMERDVAHECNPETVATVSLLANDTKPCPNCHMQIFRVSGCDDMFCTNCHTGFNWRTGRAQQTLHNPHYFEWLRRNGGQIPRTPGDAPCRQDLTHATYTNIRRLILDKHSSSPTTDNCIEFIEKLIRNALHMRYVIVPSYEQRGRFQRNEQLRIMYMRNQITEDHFKTVLQRDQKKSEKMREIHNILDLLLTTVTDIIFRFWEHLNVVAAGGFNMTILDEVEPIVKYANECLLDVSITYKSKLVQFKSDLAE
jgi:hypothetical protein